MVTAGRLRLCFLWPNHPLASSKQVYFMPCSLYIKKHSKICSFSSSHKAKNVVLMQVTNLPTRTTGLHPTNPVVCPPCELFWPVRKITGWRCSLHVGSCYIWKEDFHKSKVNMCDLCIPLLAQKSCIHSCTGHLAAIRVHRRPQACFL